MKLDIDNIMNELEGKEIKKETNGLARYRRDNDNWENIRLMVRARDGFACRHCGITEFELGRSLDVHHLKPFLESEDSSMDNLITLCRSCHKKADLEILKQRRKNNGLL